MCLLFNRFGKVSICTSAALFCCCCTALSHFAKHYENAWILLHDFKRIPFIWICQQIERWQIGKWLTQWFVISPFHYVISSEQWNYLIAQQQKKGQNFATPSKNELITSGRRDTKNTNRVVGVRLLMHLFCRF